MYTYIYILICIVVIVRCCCCGGGGGCFHNEDRMGKCILNMRILYIYSEDILGISWVYIYILGISVVS